MTAMTEEQRKGLVDAVKLGIMMLGIEARAHRDNQEPKKAAPVFKAMMQMTQALIDIGEEL